MDRDGAGLFVGVAEIEHQRLDIAIEDDADKSAELLITGLPDCRQ